MIKKFNKYLAEDYEGLFDKIKGSKSKIESVLKTHGYNSSEEFIKDVQRINGYAEILDTDNCSSDVTIENILRVYNYKQNFEDVFGVIDELNNLLLEIKDEGLTVSMKYNQTYNSGGNQDFGLYTGHKGTKRAGIKRRNFVLNISSSEELSVSVLYLIFGVLMETEGRAEISFKVEGIGAKSVSLRTFIDDEPKSEDKKKLASGTQGIDAQQALRDILAQRARHDQYNFDYDEIVDYDNGNITRRQRPITRRENGEFF